MIMVFPPCPPRFSPESSLIHFSIPYIPHLSLSKIENRQTKKLNQTKIKIRKEGRKEGHKKCVCTHTESREREG